MGCDINLRLCEHFGRLKVWSEMFSSLNGLQMYKHVTNLFKGAYISGINFESSKGGNKSITRLSSLPLIFPTSMLSGDQSYAGRSVRPWGFRYTRLEAILSPVIETYIDDRVYLRLSLIHI